MGIGSKKRRQESMGRNSEDPGYRFRLMHVIFGFHDPKRAVRDTERYPRRVLTAAGADGLSTEVLVSRIPSDDERPSWTDWY